MEINISVEAMKEEEKERSPCDLCGQLFDPEEAESCGLCDEGHYEIWSKSLTEVTFMTTAPGGIISAGIAAVISSLIMETLFCVKIAAIAVLKQSGSTIITKNLL